MPYDWSRFRLRIPVAAATEVIYNRWATSEGLTSWFLRQADFDSNEGLRRGEDELVRPGDSYLWRWHGYADDVQEKGTILLANHSDELSFSFGKAGKVHMRITRVKDMAICEIEQTEIPTDEQGIELYHLGCMKGWLFYLANLKSLLEGGIDLRNRDIALTDMINA